MKTKNYATSSATSKLPFLLLVVAIILAHTLSADAVCSLKIRQELAQDSRDLIAKIKSQNASNLDYRFYKANREDPLLSAFNAVGIVTSIPVGTGQMTYGSAVLVNRCYILTNRHVVEGIAEARKKALTLGQVQYFSVGQNEPCDKKNPFKIGNLKATVIDFGSNSEALEKDWAILKLDRPIPDSIQPVQLTREPILLDSAIYRVGYPSAAVIDPLGFASVRVRQERVVDSGGGYIESTNGDNLNGLSGGGVFSLSTGKDSKQSLILKGIHSRGVMDININYLLQDVQKNGRGTLAEIDRPKSPGSCE